MKKLALAVGSLAALLVAVPSSTAGPVDASFVSLPRAAAPGELSQYGHIRALVKTGSSYRLRFDPAFWLTGLTANKAAAEDGVVAPGEPVPNDYYVRDESHRTLTYVVRRTARVTVLDRQLRSARISVAALSQVVKGRPPAGLSLYDRANGLGYWLLVDSDTVRSIDQQYQP